MLDSSVPMRAPMTNLMPRFGASCRSAYPFEERSKALGSLE